MPNTHFTGVDAETFTMNGTLITATADELNLIDGVTATAAEMNRLDGQPAHVTWVVGSEGANTVNVALVLKDANGAACATRKCFPLFVSGTSDASSFVTTGPDGHIIAGLSGAILSVVTDKLYQIITNAAGSANINVVETSSATFYLAAVMPNGTVAVSSVLTFS